MLTYFGGGRRSRSAVAMAIWFFLLVVHATTMTSAGRTTTQPDRQMLEANQTPTERHLGSTKQQGVVGRHYWHWLHKQGEPSQSEVARPRRRWREVANGDEEDNYRMDNDMLPSQSDLLENRSAHPHADEETPDGDGHHQGNGHNGIHVASWRWDEIGIYITFTTFIIVAGLAKVAFHHAHVISSRIPESCLLILLGTAVGGILYAAGVGLCEGVRGATRIPGCHPTGSDNDEEFRFPTFTPKLFFLILLPPIILESSYSLYDRAFADNIGTVLFYAVIGTIFNTFLIGFSLLGLVAIGWIGAVRVPEESNVEWWTGPYYTLQATDCLVFSALISAVDPVAVLAIFQEVGINKDLYFLVFGESLLNDAVTVVLYSMMVVFAQMEGNVSGEQYALGIASFFTISLGGLGLGILCGLLTALITRTTSEVRVVEPLAVLGMAYFSYLIAELFHFSGIISCIGCGLVQAHYAFANVSHKSFTTVKYFIKMLSSTSDAIIFLFLGMVLVNDVHEWHTSFVLWVLFLCLVVRFLGVFLLTAIANRFRLKPVNLQEQFIMAYGGLRGAVSFSLVEMLLPSVIKPRQMFVTTTLAVILFTVFVQGGTIKLFVRLLHIQKDSKSVKYLMNEMNETMFDHLTAGIEEICGHRGNNFFREKIEYIDERYLRPIFTRSTDKNSLQRLFEKLTLREHATNMYHGTGEHPDMTPVPSTAKIVDPEPNDVQEAKESSSPVVPVRSDIALEVSPLLPQSPLPGQVELLQAKRPKGRYPLVRQQSAPPGSMLPARASTPGSAAFKATRELSDFPDVQLRKKNLMGKRSRPNSGESTNSGNLDPDATAQAFRKALRTTSSNQYKRVYQKHNRNLIGDDDMPELEMALRRRLSSVGGQRLPQTISSVFNSPLSSPGTPTSPASPAANPSSSSFDGGSHFPFTVNGETPTRPLAATTRREGRRSISPTRSQPPSIEFSTESERSVPISSNKRPRPDTLRTTAGFAPLRVIAERDREHSSSSLHITDLENGDDGGPVVVAVNTRISQPTRPSASKETGV